MNGSEKSSFETLINNLTEQVDVLNLEEQNSTPIENFNKDVHWQKMGLSCEAVSKECTKLAVVFSKPPLPSVDDVTSLMKEISQAVDVLLSWYKTFPISEGKILHKVLHDCIASILSSVSDFVKTTENDKTTHGKARLTSTGNVWSCCDQFKTLPKDNTSAAVKEIDTMYDLITDAIGEVQQSVKDYEGEMLNDNEDSEDDDWSESDRKLVAPSVGLLIASKGLLKKTKVALKSTGNKNNNEIDQIVMKIKNISSSVDDFVLLIYPPVIKENVLKHAIMLSEVLTNILNYIRSSSSLCTEDNLSWIDFVDKAIKHNVNTLKSMITL